MISIILFIIFALSLSALVIGCLAYTRKKGAPNSIAGGTGWSCTSDSQCYPGKCVSSRCTPSGAPGTSCADGAGSGDNDICQNGECGRYGTSETDYRCCPNTRGDDHYCTVGHDWCYMNLGEPCATNCQCGGDCVNGVCTNQTSCIANSQLIDTKTKGLIYLKDLKPGDYVHNGEYYDLVYFIQEHKGKFEVLNIHLGNDILKLTSEHLVYLDDKMVCAGSLNIGDLIQGESIKNITKTVESVRNPMTISGKLLLGEIVASCYTHSEEHAKELQKLADCFDFEKLTEQIGSGMVQELVNTMYNKLANETFRKDRIFKPLLHIIEV